MATWALPEPAAVPLGGRYPAVLVTNVSCATTPKDLEVLFSTAGILRSSIVHTPPGGEHSTCLLTFADELSASNAVDYYNSYPMHGTFLEVRRADAALVEQLAELFAAAAAGGVSAASAAASHGAPAAATPPPPPLLSAPYGVDPYGDSALSLQAPWQGLSLHDELPEPAGGPSWLPDYSVPDPYATPAAPAQATGHAPPASNGTADAADAEGGWAAAVAAAPRRRRQQQQQQPASALAPAPAPAPARAAKQSPQESDLVDDPRCHLCIKGVMKGVSADTIRVVFGRFGKVADASVVPTKGIGFVSFRELGPADAAREALHGTKVPQLGGNQPIAVERRPKGLIRRYVDGERQDNMDKPTVRLWVGFLPRTTKLAVFRKHMEKYGEVTHAFIGGGNDGGEMYAFAQYRRLEDAIRAHDTLHGKAVPALAGPTRPLLVAYKEPRF